MAAEASAPDSRATLRGTVDQPPDAIVDQLVVDAIASGAASRRARWSHYQRFSSGSTAQAVGQLDLSIPCVFKMDTAAKLVEEANVLLDIADRTDLSPGFRSCFPQIYAVHDTPPVYAYLMEQFEVSQGFVGMEALLFGPPQDGHEVSALRVANRLMDLLFGAYGDSRNHRLRPSIWVDYVDRIQSRLADAAELNDKFASRPVRVPAHDETYRPWLDYLSALARERRTIESLAPPFTTFVHGDPNPENVLARIDETGVDLRFIDVKEWRDGDYLFDVAKFLHYLVVTGPVERLGATQVATRTSSNGDGIEIAYELALPGWLTQTRDTVHARVREFGRASGDTSQDHRLLLGMASNLLGLPAGRLRQGKEESALVCFAEGLRYLEQFCLAVGVLVA